jgi:hypothetical protein
MGALMQRTDFLSVFTGSAFMNHNNSHQTSHSESGEFTSNCRKAALDHYCHLFSKGLFPILVEENGGAFRVMLPAEVCQ